MKPASLNRTGTAFIHAYTAFRRPGEKNRARSSCLTGAWFEPSTPRIWRFTAPRPLLEQSLLPPMPKKMADYGLQVPGETGVLL